MNNSSQSELDLGYFYVKCINDYVHFILSFYYLTLSEDQYKEVKNILYTYFLEGKFDVALFSSPPQILKNFHNTYGNKLSAINKMESLMINNKMKALVDKSKKRNLSNFFPTNENGPDPNSPKLTLLQKRQLKAQLASPALKWNVVEGKQNDNSSPQPTKLLRQDFGPFNRLSNFREIKTSGQQSNMMVSANGNLFFKTLKSQKLSKIKQFENECRVYGHLKETNPLFLQNSTCFVACYSDGILLKNGGLSLHELLQEPRSVNPGQLRINLQQFFPKLLQLQLCGVSHDDLHCGNVVGFDRDDLRFIDFGLAKTCQQSPNGNFLERLNMVFREIFFSFATKYELF
jgi:hypothetical protein